LEKGEVSGVSDDIQREKEKTAGLRKWAFGLQWVEHRSNSPAAIVFLGWGKKPRAADFYFLI